MSKSRLLCYLKRSVWARTGVAAIAVACVLWLVEYRFRKVLWYRLPALQALHMTKIREDGTYASYDRDCYVTLLSPTSTFLLPLGVLALSLSLYMQKRHERPAHTDQPDHEVPKHSEAHMAGKPSREAGQAGSIALGLALVSLLLVSSRITLDANALVPPDDGIGPRMETAPKLAFLTSPAVAILAFLAAANTIFTRAVAKTARRCAVIAVLLSLSALALIMLAWRA